MNCNCGNCKNCKRREEDEKRKEFDKKKYQKNKEKIKKRNKEKYQKNPNKFKKQSQLQRERHKFLHNWLKQEVQKQNHKIKSIPQICGLIEENKLKIIIEGE